MPVTLDLADRFGVFDRSEYFKLPHALRSARNRASSWNRTIFVYSQSKIWTVTPNRLITVKKRDGHQL